jgi:hypothetical protein
MPLAMSKKITEAIIDSSKVSLEVNVEKTKYMLKSHHQNAGRNCNIKIANRSFENVTKFKYLGMAVTNQNLIHDKIKRRLDSGNAWYHLFQSLSSSHLMIKNVKM